MRRVIPVRRMLIALVAACAVCGVGPLLAAKREILPRVANAELLTGWPPFRLAIAAPGGTTPVQSDDPLGGWRVTPSITADGLLVASARPKSGLGPSHLVVSVWSRESRQWTAYDRLEVRSGTVAISPDGTRLACVTLWRWDAPSRLEVLDRKTGRIVQGPEVFQDAGTDISWAPDSRRLVFDMGDNGSPVKQDPTPLRAIYTMDARSGAVRRIAKGVAPAWSPSGEWIAFLDYVPASDDAGPGFAAERPNRVEVMRPDGTGVRALTTFPRQQGLLLAPVWLPDSQAVLVQRWHDPVKETVDGDRVDLATGRTERLFQDRAPVFAWRKQSAPDSARAAEAGVHRRNALTSGS